MTIKKARNISNKIERELWARAAGRCQFSGCNKLIYKSEVTQERVNLSQKAHIYSFSENGPRGRGPYENQDSNIHDISNLMLVCHGCHQKIDQDKDGIKYSPNLLKHWKAEHEHRVEIVTGISSNKKSHTVLYGANIGSERSPINYHSCIEAMFPERYPSKTQPISIEVKNDLKDRKAIYWLAEKENLLSSFKQSILPIIKQDECKHFSLFALAPQPLLVWLGALFTDKIDVDTYQLHREPKTWKWLDYDEDFDFVIERPDTFTGIPALVLALSDNIANERISSAIEKDCSIWKVTIKNPHNDFLKAKHQLSLFRKLMRTLIVEIKSHHGFSEPLHILPAMPISCAIELGRVRMPKADMPWIIYDHDGTQNKFVKAIEIEGDLHEL